MYPDCWAWLIAGIIKSSDKIQGDERDIVLISTVYDSENQRFGYLDRKDSYKRMNVIFTRAKK